MKSKKVFKLKQEKIQSSAFLKRFVLGETEVKYCLISRVLDDIQYRICDEKSNADAVTENFLLLKIDEAETGDLKQVDVFKNRISQSHYIKVRKAGKET